MKFKNRWGLLLHVLIVMACLAVFCWPYLGQMDVWLFLVFIGVTHYTQDLAKMRLTGTKHGLFFFVLDQALHILFISAIFLTSLQNIQAPLPADSSPVFSLYASDHFVLYIMGMIIASYMAHYMIILFKTDCLNINGSVSAFEKRYGFLERIIIFSAILAGGLWVITVPVILTLRILSFEKLRRQFTISDRFASAAETALSGTAGVLTGLTFLLFL